MKLLKWLGVIVVGLIVIGFISAMLGDKPATTTGGDKAKFTVQVSGTEGTAFSGSYMVVTADGKSVSKSVEGVVPASYDLDGAIVSVSFQKKGESGKLAVKIMKGDKVAAESETEAAYGVVTAATQ